MVQEADGFSTTEMNDGVLDLSCKDIQDFICFFVQLTSINRYEQPTGVLGND